MNLRYLSICSGIEAATVAWQPLGFIPVWLAEIEPFARAVLAHHHRSVPNRGDITRFKEWPDAAVDVLVGGTPCQSFSIAGFRAGLADPRGNLALVYLAIADRYRPRWLVWENVAGVLSTNGGRDFGAILGGLVELGYGFGYRVLDAQYVRAHGFQFAVPQRRRRVIVVGYLGDWRRAVAVLFERESLCWDHPPRREAGQGIGPTLSARLTGGGGLGTDFDCDGGLIPEVANPLTARMTKGVNTTLDEGVTMVAVADPISANEHRTTSHAGNNIRLHNVVGAAQVRRLTPRECERLMGFPDDYTLVPYRKRLAADGPRYRALGNSFAVNVMRWVGQRIQLVEGVA